MFVVAVERYHNCPTHDRGTFSGQKGFKILGDLIDFVKKNINECHVISVYCTHDLDQDFMFNYEKSGHKFVGCELKINGKMFAQLRDNGSGKLEWNYDQ